MNMNEKNKIENCRIEPKLKLINMDSVEVEQVEWLLYPFIPYGKVTIIQGDPGEGFSDADHDPDHRGFFHPECCPVWQ